MAAPTATQDPATTIHGLRSFFRFTSSVGVRQVEVATAAGTISTSGDLSVVVTAAGVTGSPITLSVGVLDGDTPVDWAQKVRVALAGNGFIAALYDVAPALDATITLTRKVAAANDDTLNIAIDNDDSAGATTAATSTTATAGSAAGSPVEMISMMVDYEGQNETILNLAPGADSIARPNRESQKSSQEAFTFDLVEISKVITLLGGLNKVIKGVVEIWVYDPDDASGVAKLRTNAFACSAKRVGNVGFGGDDFSKTQVKYLNLSGADVDITPDTADT